MLENGLMTFYDYFRHGWLHHQTDDPPTVKPPLVQKFSADHIENKSGTDDRFVPYSTTRPKIHSWKPPQ